MIFKSLGFTSSGRNGFSEDEFLTKPELGLFVFASGFGGKAGKEAALVACESVFSYLSREKQDPNATLPFRLRATASLAGNLLYNSFAYANRVLLDKKPRLAGSTSMIAVYVDDPVVSVLSVGSTSCSLFRAGKVENILKGEHYGMYLDPTQTDWPERFKIPLQSLGMFEDLDPRLVEFRVKEGDRIFLESDRFPRTLAQKMWDELGVTPVDQDGLEKVQHLWSDASQQRFGSVLIEACPELSTTAADFLEPKPSLTELKEPQHLEIDLDQ